MECAFPRRRRVVVVVVVVGCRGQGSVVVVVVVVEVGRRRVRALRPPPPVPQPHMELGVVGPTRWLCDGASRKVVTGRLDVSRNATAWRRGHWGQRRRRASCPHSRPHREPPLDLRVDSLSHTSSSFLDSTTALVAMSPPPPTANKVGPGVRVFSAFLHSKLTKFTHSHPLLSNLILAPPPTLSLSLSLRVSLPLVTLPKPKSSLTSSVREVWLL
jgi:hypothetical protein